MSEKNNSMGEQKTDSLDKSVTPDGSSTDTKSPQETVDGVSAVSTVGKESHPFLSDGGDSAQTQMPAAQTQEPGPISTDELRQKIIQVLHTVYDPEIPVDIWELGLIYRLDIDANGDVYIQMTLTSPMCPVAGSLPPEVERKVASVPGVKSVRVELTWDPPWNMAMMSDVARLTLGFM
jgi:FeS assembly SUF system protein